MNEGEQALQVTYKGAELTIDVIQKLLAAIFSNNGRPASKTKTITGKQSIKRLTKQGKDLTSISLDEKPDFVSFKSELKKHGVDFSVMKGNDSYEIFFKAVDAAQIEHSLKRVVKEAAQENQEKDNLQENQPEVTTNDSQTKENPSDKQAETKEAVKNETASLHTTDKAASAPQQKQSIHKKIENAKAKANTLNQTKAVTKNKGLER